MHGSNAPLLGRIINQQMERLKAGDPVTEAIALEDAVPESELHLDLALEKQERLSKELSVKMENKKLFDETEFALFYLQVNSILIIVLILKLIMQEYVHSEEASYDEITAMIAEAGLSLMDVCEARLEDEEPRTLLKDTGFEDQCAKLNGHPAKCVSVLMYIAHH